MATSSGRKRTPASPTPTSAVPGAEAKVTRQPRTQAIPAKVKMDEVFIETSGFFALLSATNTAHAQIREQMVGLARRKERRAILTIAYRPPEPSVP